MGSCTPAMPPTTAELETYRRSLDLRIDANGQLLHEGQPIAHPGVRQALLNGLAVLPTGEACLRIGAQWAYVRCDFTPFVAARAQLLADGLLLRLNTGRTVRATVAELKLRLHNDSVLLIALPAQGLLVRCGHAAWMQLADHLSYSGATLELHGPAWSLPVNIT